MTVATIDLCTAFWNLDLSSQLAHRRLVSQGGGWQPKEENEVLCSGSSRGWCQAPFLLSPTPPGGHLGGWGPPSKQSSWQVPPCQALATWFASGHTAGPVLPPTLWLVLSPTTSPGPERPLQVQSKDSGSSPVAGGGVEGHTVRGLLLLPQTPGRLGNRMCSGHSIHPAPALQSPPLV